MLVFVFSLLWLSQPSAAHSLHDAMNVIRKILVENFLQRPQRELLDEKREKLSGMHKKCRWQRWGMVRVHLMQRKCWCGFAGCLAHPRHDDDCQHITRNMLYFGSTVRTCNEIGIENYHCQRMQRMRKRERERGAMQKVQPSFFTGMHNRIWNEIKEVCHSADLLGKWRTRIETLNLIW